jgi:hypothetical protein
MLPGNCPLFLFIELVLIGRTWFLLVVRPISWPEIKHAKGFTAKQVRTHRCILLTAFWRWRAAADGTNSRRPIRLHETEPYIPRPFYAAACVHLSVVLLGRWENRPPQLCADYGWRARTA